MKNISILKILVFSSVLLTCLWSCTKDQGPLIIKPLPVPGDTMVSYADFIQPIFDANCIRCHSQGHPFLDLRDCCSYDELLLTGSSAPYIDSIDPANSLLIGHLEGVEYSPMPPDGALLSQGIIDSVKIWMRQGARNN